MVSGAATPAEIQKALATASAGATVVLRASDAAAAAPPPDPHTAAAAAAMARYTVAIPNSSIAIDLTEESALA